MLYARALLKKEYGIVVTQGECYNKQVSRLHGRAARLGLKQRPVI